MGGSNSSAIVVQCTDAKREFLLEKTASQYNHRMFCLTTEETYKAGIGRKIFKTPRDLREATYSL
jgi:hypothetical protein